MTTHAPNTVLIAPDSSTKYLTSAVDTTLNQMAPAAVLAIDITSAEARIDIAQWCLNGNRRVLNPFAHYLDTTLLVQNPDRPPETCQQTKPTSKKNPHRDHPRSHIRHTLKSPREAIRLWRWRRNVRNQPEPRLNGWGYLDNGYW